MDNWSKTSPNTEVVKRRLLYVCNPPEFLKPKGERVQSWNVTKQWMSSFPGWKITRYMIQLLAIERCTLAKLWYSREPFLRKDLLVTWLRYRTLFQVRLQYIWHRIKRGPIRCWDLFAFLNRVANQIVATILTGRTKLFRLKLSRKLEKEMSCCSSTATSFLTSTDVFAQHAICRRRVADFTLPSSAVDSLTVGNLKEVAKKCNSHSLPTSPRRKSKVAKIREYEQRLLNPMTLDALMPLEPIHDPASSVNWFSLSEWPDTWINSGIP